MDAAAAGPALRCRTVSLTPTYDQLRGERINADVPASETDPQPVDRPGRHRIPDGTLAAPAPSGPSPEGGESAKDWSGFAKGDSDPSGKHKLRDEAPAAPERQAALSGAGKRRLRHENAVSGTNRNDVNIADAPSS